MQDPAVVVAEYEKRSADLTRHALVIEGLLRRRQDAVGLEFESDEEYQALRAAWVALTVRAADACDHAARMREYAASIRGER